MEDIHRIIQIRTAKQACSTLLQRGSVGDALWQRFLRAEQEMEAELKDVVMEVSDSIIVNLEIGVGSLIIHRQMLLLQIGVLPSSSPRTKWLPTQCFDRSWMISRHRPNPRKHGGKRDAHQSRPNS